MRKKEKIAVYPGSFDPPTFGHLDVINRSLEIFDKIIVLVSDNKNKNYMFSKDERFEMVKEMTKDIEKVSVENLPGLLVDYLKKKKMRIVIRGLRITSDFDYEFQMSSLNRVLYPKIETIYIISDIKYILLSSSLVRELISNNGDISKFVPPEVEKFIKNRGAR
ncbi:MAG TPA: pantetheine-phosphate adenylyltransferase [Caldisericia bacterium]|nr:pantetheine-phosphate adenylyltransferase [Caldisericia bacterium]HPB33171.1 pantetheine-phosphate adenylyltransferase [Caldisericia bacterium]HQL66359.1 pantetheine-phosphate adenylyltransferase [Caldisericia bacterium]HQN48411.1 pantetheine-phosphate adenylyltransferase [Caldisericia bacterium]HQO99014.1 pantetheine-phosphate adenylyltransferase [Caldisericia bacterium]